MADFLTLLDAMKQSPSEYAFYSGDWISVPRDFVAVENGLK